MRTINVAGDVIGVPDDADDAALDRIAQNHLRSKRQQSAQASARQTFEGVNPVAKLAIGLGASAAEPVMGLKQAALKFAGRPTEGVEEQIATVRGAREAAGGWGTAGELAGWAAGGMAKAPAALVNLAGRALPGAVARFAAPVAQEAATQAAYEGSRGTLQDDPSRAQRAQQGALWGAGGAAAGDIAARGAKRLIAPTQLTPDAQAMQQSSMAAGGPRIPFTVGQASGRDSVLGQIEQGLTGLPIIGPAVNRARGGSVDAWNQSQLNQAVGALMPHGKSIGEAGSMGIARAQELVDNAYRSAVQGVTLNVPPNANPFLRTQRAIAQLPPQDAEIAQKALDVTLDAARSGKVAGDDIIALRSRLDKLASQYYRQGNYSVGEALDQLDDDFRDLSGYFMSPRQQATLVEANAAYTRLKPINRAAGMKGALENDSRFTPSQLVSGVTRGMPDSVKARQGNEQLEEALQAGRVLGNQLPNPGPGTAEKLMIGGGLVGAGAIASEALLEGDPQYQKLAAIIGPAAAYAMLASGGGKRYMIAGDKRAALAAALRDRSIGPTRSAAARLAAQEDEERRQKLRGY